MPEEKVIESPEKDEQKVFPAEYVHDLREENKRHRLEKNQYAEQLAELKKKADEFDALQKKALEEQGKYKELYEKAQADIAKKSELETRLKAIEQGYSDELEGIKKSLTADEIKLIDGLESVKIEQRLALARTLSGKKQAPITDEARGGSSSTSNAEAILKEYSGAKRERKFAILAEVEKTNPALYKQLLKS